MLILRLLKIEDLFLACPVQGGHPVTSSAIIHILRKVHEYKPAGP